MLFLSLFYTAIERVDTTLVACISAMTVSTRMVVAVISWCVLTLQPVRRIAFVTKIEDNAW